MLTTATATSNAMKGFLYDIYHIKDKAILWVKVNDKKVKRLEYSWSPFIYVVSDKKFELTLLLNNDKIMSFIKEYEFVNKFEHPEDNTKKEILKLTVNDSDKLVNLVKEIENLSKNFKNYRLYNVDISHAQAFLFEKDIYPLGCFKITEKLSQFNGLYFDIETTNNDNISSFDYSIPNFRILTFNFILEKKTIYNNFDNKILTIRVKVLDKDNVEKKEGEEFLISKDCELETILELAHEIKKIDPDIILTKGGDQFLFPQLLYRAKINKINFQLITNLNREPNQEFLQEKFKYFLKDNLLSDNTSSLIFIFFYLLWPNSFWPNPFYLYGRIHIDIETSFIYKEARLEGLSEISRICRIPIANSFKGYNRKMS